MTKNRTHKTREQWLVAAVALINQEVFNKTIVDWSSVYYNSRHNIKKDGVQYYSVPKDVKVTCGFTPTGNTARRHTLGCCFPRAASKSGVNEIFISPVEDDKVKILDTLTHELVHAIDDCQNGHNSRFWHLCCAIGLNENKPTSAAANKSLLVKLRKIGKTLGNYPHDLLTLNRKKQNTRNIKVSCDCCEFSFRTSQKNIDLMQVTNCLSCNEGYLQPNY